MSRTRNLNLGSLGVFYRGYGGTKEDEDKDGLPCVRYGDIYTHHGNIIKSFTSHISHKSSANYFKLENGDIVLAGSGEPHDEIGKATTFNGDIPAYAGGDTIIFRPCKNALNPLFAGYALNSLPANKFKSRMGQGSTVVHISSDSLKDLPLPTPSIALQKKIAKILTTVDKAIEHTEALIEKHEKIKAGMMHDLFTRGLWTKEEIDRGDHKGLPCEATAKPGTLRPKPEDAPHLYRESPLGKIPKEWLFTTCSNLCEKVIDCKNRTPPITESGHPVIRTPNVRNGQFVDSELVYTDDCSYLIWTARGKPKSDDIVITREAPVGEVCKIPDRHPEACLGQRMMLYRADPDKVVNDYFLYALQSYPAQKRLDIISGGSTVGHVRVGDIRSLWIVLPVSRDEQAKIAQVLNKMSEKNINEQIYAIKLEKQKSGLMHDLLT